MWLFGLILLLGGAGSIFYGYQMSKSIDAHIAALRYLAASSPGTIWIFAGLVVVIVGAILLISSTKK